jgi:endonuclease VIII
MPEGHTVHRVTRQFVRSLAGQVIAASSPQGRFVEGAAQIDGLQLTDARAIGKLMFLGFEHDRWIQVHLGLFGMWKFAGDILLFDFPAGPVKTSSRVKQSREFLQWPNPDAHLSRGRKRSDPTGSRHVSRWRVSEEEAPPRSTSDDAPEGFPPEPVGAVRLRLLGSSVVADLHGPSKCEALDSEGVEALAAKLGPDPLFDDGPAAEARVLEVVRREPTPIGVLLMDQTVIAGIGNVYRAELLFRARLNPHTPGREVPEEKVHQLWLDWSKLLGVGVETGQMFTMEEVDDPSRRKPVTRREDMRFWVFHREGLPCHVCKTDIIAEQIGGRTVYWCPACQA